jgi:hypothetical protein
VGAFRRAIASLSKQDLSRQAITLTLEWFGVESERVADGHPIALE